jgi:hypothetical protein
MDNLLIRLKKLINRMKEQNRISTALLIPKRAKFLSKDIKKVFDIPIVRMEIPRIVLMSGEHHVYPDGVEISYAFCIPEDGKPFEVASLDQRKIEIVDGEMRIGYQSSLEELIKKQLKV